MSRSTDKDIEKFVFEQMPTKVKKALADAKYDLYYGPSGGGGMGFVKASEIVERWWDEYMNDDLVVDDGGNVSTSYDFDKYVKQLGDERFTEAFQEAIDDGDEGMFADTRASEEATSYIESEYERATVYDSSDVRRLILGKDWP